MALLQDPLMMVFFAVALITALTVHEFSHAYVANSLGDDTARLQGRISLNPMKHLDPVGTLDDRHSIVDRLWNRLGQARTGKSTPTPDGPSSRHGVGRCGRPDFQFVSSGCRLAPTEVRHLFNIPSFQTLLGSYRRSQHLARGFQHAPDLPFGWLPGVGGNPAERLGKSAGQAGTVRPGTADPPCLRPPKRTSGIFRLDRRTR